METIPHRTTGAIRKLKRERGYGFIAGDDGRDYFFHWSAIDKASTNYRDLVAQDRVEFDTVATEEKGPRAVAIRVL